jgi:hypothetical protein
VEIKSDYGHDAFLLEVERLGELARDFLAGVEREAVRLADPANGRTPPAEEREQKIYPLSRTNTTRVALRSVDSRKRETA